MKFAFVIGIMIAFAGTLLAEDKNGLRLSMSKKTLNRDDGRASEYTREISRLMSLKANLKNISMKDQEEGKIDFIILIKRWGSLETDNVERVTGTIEIPALRAAQDFEALAGEYHIGGHMHGTSDRHVDQLGGWKLTITQGERTTEFTSGSSFERLNRRADKNTAVR